MIIKKGEPEGTALLNIKYVTVMYMMLNINSMIYHRWYM